MPCFSHTLNLAVREAVAQTADLAQLLAGMQKLTKILKKSALLSDRFEAICDEKEISEKILQLTLEIGSTTRKPNKTLPKKLAKYVPTRFTSICKCVLRLRVLWPPILALLNSELFLTSWKRNHGTDPVPLHEGHGPQIAALVKTMKRLDSIATAIQGQNIFLGRAYLALYMFKKELSGPEPSTSAPVGNDFRQKLAAAVKARFFEFNSSLTDDQSPQKAEFTVENQPKSLFLVPTRDHPCLVDVGMGKETRSLNRPLDLVLASLRLDPACHGALHTADLLDELEKGGPIPPLKHGHHQIKPRDAYFTQLLSNLCAWVTTDLRLMRTFAAASESRAANLKPGSSAAVDPDPLLSLLLGDSPVADGAVARSTAEYSKQHITAEVHSFLNTQHRAEEARCPLEFWRQKEMQWPLLAVVAARVFTVMVTSCEAERTFSTAGNICTDRRARLTKQQVDDMVFIHQHVLLTRRDLKEIHVADPQPSSAASAAGSSNVPAQAESISRQPTQVL
jgi:hypothetical protein